MYIYVDVVHLWPPSLQFGAQKTKLYSWQQQTRQTRTQISCYTLYIRVYTHHTHRHTYMSIILERMRTRASAIISLFTAVCLAALAHVCVSLACICVSQLFLVFLSYIHVYIVYVSFVSISIFDHFPLCARIPRECRACTIGAAAAAAACRRRVIVLAHQQPSRYVYSIVCRRGDGVHKVHKTHATHNDI